MPSFTDEHGVVIVYDVYPVDRPKAVVELVHGIGDHAGRYAHVASALNAAGYSVYAGDQRGHGRTGMGQWGDPAKLGVLGPGGLRAVETDLLQFAELIRGENPGAPLVLLGHSWGSLLAQRLINTHADAFDAVVLTGTAYRMPGSMRPGNLNARHKHLGDTGREWLSRDPAVHVAFNDDPWCFDVDVLGKFGVADTLRLTGRPARHLGRDLPLLIQIGSDDSLGGEKSVVRLANAYRSRSGLSDITVHVYEGARHEIFNETNKDEVLADLVSWLDERVSLPAA